MTARMLQGWVFIIGICIAVEGIREIYPPAAVLTAGLLLMLGIVIMRVTEQ